MQQTGGNLMAVRTQQMGVNPETEVTHRPPREQELEAHTPVRVKRVAQGKFLKD